MNDDDDVSFCFCFLDHEPIITDLQMGQGKGQKSYTFLDGDAWALSSRTKKHSRRSGGFDIIEFVRI